MVWRCTAAKVRPADAMLTSEWLQVFGLMKHPDGRLHSSVHGKRHAEPLLGA